MAIVFFRAGVSGGSVAAVGRGQTVSQARADRAATTAAFLRHGIGKDILVSGDHARKISRAADRPEALPSENLSPYRYLSGPDKCNDMDVTIAVRPADCVGMNAAFDADSCDGRKPAESRRRC